jgi:DNA-binding helix-hairpin-helix protein with protein kinase domain
VPTIDVDDPAVRLRISPLNVVAVASSAPPEVTGLPQAEREASTDAFHLAMLIAAALLAAGAVTNAVGIVDDVAKKAAAPRG